MMRVSQILPYYLPIFLTGFFIILSYSGWIYLGPFILPFLGLFNKAVGKFSVSQLAKEYIAFHHSIAFSILKIMSGIFFILFNVWIVYFLSNYELTLIQYVFFIYTVIILNSNFSVSLAHELIHHHHTVARILGTSLMLINGFFYLENDHVYTHHRFVGTAQDPASARQGESLYIYLYRSIPARIAIFFGLKANFPQAQKRTIVRGNMVRLLVCILLAVMALVFNWKVGAWLLIQFVLVPLIYEIVTYIQHYGLNRSQITSGKFEPVEFSHSWNCYYRLSNYLLFLMPIHSIHHLKIEPDVTKITDFGPSFPFPFSQMAFLAMIPSRWSRVMDPLVAEVKKTGST